MKVIIIPAPRLAETLVHVLEFNWEISSVEQQTAEGAEEEGLCSEAIHVPKENVILDSSENKLCNRFVWAPEGFLGVS